MAAAPLKPALKKALKDALGYLTVMIALDSKQSCNAIHLTTVLWKFVIYLVARPYAIEW